MIKRVRFLCDDRGSSSCPIGIVTILDFGAWLAAAGNKGHRYDPERRDTRESRAVPAPDANAKLVISMQKRQAQSNSKSRSEMFNSHQEEVASGFPIDPPRPSQGVEETSNDPQFNLHMRASHSRSLIHRATWGKAGKNTEDAPKISTGADFSAMSGLVAARRSLLCEEHRDKSSTSQQEVSKLYSRVPRSFKEVSNSMTKQDQITRVVEGSCQNEGGRGGSNDPVLILQCLSIRGLTSSGGSGVGADGGGTSSGVSRAIVKDRHLMYNLRSFIKGKVSGQS